MIQHFKASKNISNRHVLLYQKINKYGKDKVKYEILENNIENKEKLGEREAYYINKFNSYFKNNHLGLNMTLTGRGGLAGELNHRAQLTDDIVYLIKKYFSEGVIREDLKYKYNINDRQLSRILTGDRWLSVGKEFNNKIEGLLREEKVSDEVIICIKEGFLEGIDRQSLSNMFEVGYNTVCGIISLTNYTEIGSELNEKINEIVISEKSNLEKMSKKQKEELIFNVKKSFVLGESKKEICKKYSIELDYLNSILRLEINYEMGSEFNGKIKDMKKLEKSNLYELIFDIKKSYLENERPVDIAKRLNLDIKYISRIITLDRHRNIASELNKEIIKNKENKNKIITSIKESYVNGMRQIDIVNKYNVSKAFVSDIIRLERYVDVGSEFNNMVRQRRESTEHFNRKSTDNLDVIKIKELFIEGLSQSEIINRLNLSSWLVRGVISLEIYESIGKELNKKILERKRLSEFEIEELVFNIKRYYVMGSKTDRKIRKTISDIYKVKPSFVSNIIELKSYAEIGEEFNRELFKLKNITHDIIIKIKKSYILGNSISNICKNYGVNIGYVKGIIYLKTHVGVGKEFNEKIIAIRNK